MIELKITIKEMRSPDKEHSGINVEMHMSKECGAPTEIEGVMAVSIKRSIGDLLEKIAAETGGGTVIERPNHKPQEGGQ